MRWAFLCAAAACAACYSGVLVEPPPDNTTIGVGGGSGAACGGAGGVGASCTLVISSVAPARVDLGGGETITITGSNFEGGTPNASVSLGINQCIEVSVLSGTQIRCITPAVAAEEKVSVTVINGGKSAGKASSPCAGCLEFADIKGPKVTELFPLENSRVTVSVSPSVKFNEKVDPATLTSSSFFISGVAGETLCEHCTTPCADATDAAGVCFKPSQPLAYDSSFTGVVRDTITDLKGNRLQGAGSDGTLKWNFRTCVSEQDCPQ